MNLTKIEKAGRLIERIRRLDAQIIEIDRFAMLVANDEADGLLELKVDNLSKKEEDSKVKFDEDGSIINLSTDDIYQRMRRSLLSYNHPWASASSETPKDTREKLNAEISNNETLQILGVLLGSKQQKRQRLLNELSALGVNI